VFGEFFRGRAGQFWTKMPKQRVPARLQKSHHAVTDEKERTQLNQAPGYQIVVHQILSKVSEEFSNGSDLPRDRSLLKIARECGAIFYGLVPLLLLLLLFFDTRRVGTSTLE
jgi:hypothetical protein